MVKLTLVLILLIFGSEAKQPIERPNGLWYPGRSCGIATEIKYLNEFPKDTSDLECTFVWTKKVTKSPIEYSSDACFKSGYVGAFSSTWTSKMSCMERCLSRPTCTMLSWGLSSFGSVPTCYLAFKDSKVVEVKEDKTWNYATKECIANAKQN